MSGLHTIKKALLSALAKRLASSGFHLREKEQAFDRELNHVRQSLFIMCVANPRALVFTVSAGVRFHQLEDLVDRMNVPNPLATREHNESRSTLGRQLGTRLGGLFLKNWTLSSLDDVDELAKDMENFLVREGLPFLERYSSMETALASLVKDDSEANELMPLDDVRAKNAVAMAFLIGGYALASDVASKKVQFLKTRPHSGIEGVESWIQRLLTWAEQQ